MQRTETLRIGDSIFLTTAPPTAPGLLFSTDGLHGQVLVRDGPASSSSLADFQVAVFELVVPFDYMNKKRLAAQEDKLVAVKEQIQKLESEAARLQKLRPTDTLPVPVYNPSRRASVSGFPQLRRSIASPPIQSQASLTGRDSKLRELERLDREQASIAHSLKQLRRLAKHDMLNNDNKQIAQIGRTLLFGETVQLRHIPTQQFLRIQTNHRKLGEVTEVLFSLSSVSDRGCFFKLMPRSKVHSEGEPIIEGSQILIVSEKGMSQYLSRSTSTNSAIHSVDPTARPGSVVEACLSSRLTAWVPHIYSPARTTIDELRSGDVVEFYDRELEAYLAVDRLISLPSAENAGSQTLSTPSVFMNKARNKDGQPKMQSLGFWQIEAQSGHISGDPIIPGTNVAYVLRHVATGKYLGFLDRLTIPEQFDVILTDKRHGDTTAFRLSTLDVSASRIKDNDMIRIEHIRSGHIIHSSTEQESSPVVNERAWMLNKTRAQQLDAAKDDIVRVVYKSTKSVEDVYAIRLVTSQRRKDQFVVSSAAVALKAFVDAVLFSHPLTSHLYERTDQALKDLQELCTPFRPGTLWNQRQDLMLAYGVYDTLIRFITPATERTEEATRIMRVLNQRSYYQTFIQRTFEILRGGCEGESTDSDRYLSRSYKVLAAHMIYLKNPQAANVVCELVRDNEVILEDLLNDSDLGLTWLLRQVTEHANVIDDRFLHLLSSFCVCENTAVPEAQSKILTAIFIRDGGLPRMVPTFWTFTQDPRGDIVAIRGANRLSLAGLVDKRRSTFDVTSQSQLANEIGFISAQLALLRSLCFGGDKTNQALVSNVASFEFLMALATRKDADFDLRCQAAQLLSELYVVNPRHRAVIGRHRTTFIWGEHDVLPAHGVSIGGTECDYFVELHEWFVATEGLLLRDVAGFMKIAAQVLDAKRGSLYELQHREQANFIKVSLGLVRYLVVNGFYADWKLVAKLVPLLISVVLKFDGQAIAKIDPVRDSSEPDVSIDLVDVLAITIDILKLVQNMQTREFLSMFASEYQILVSPDRPVLPKRASKFSLHSNRVGDLRASSMITELHGCTNKSSSPPPAPETVRNYVESVSKACALDQLCGLLGLEAELQNALFVLCTIADPTVIRLAVETILGAMKRPSQFLQLGPQLLFLRDEESVAFFAKLSEFEAKFGVLAHEAHMGSPNPASIAAAATDLLKTMKTTSATGNRMSKQDAVAFSGIMEDVLSILHIQIEKGDKASVSAVGKCFDLLRHLAVNNDRIKRRIFTDIAEILSLPAISDPTVATHMSSMLTEVISSGDQFRLAVKEVHIRQLVDLVSFQFKSKQLVPEVLRFIRKLAHHDNSYLPRNQVIILQCLSRHEGLVARLLLVANPRRQEDFVRAYPTANSIAFVEAVDLVASMGNSDNSVMEASCKQYFSVERLLELLMLARERPAPKPFAALLHFLWGHYVNDTCRLPVGHSSSLCADTRMWFAIDHCMKLIASSRAQSTKENEGKSEARTSTNDFNDRYLLETSVYLILPFIRDFIWSHLRFDLAEYATEGAVLDSHVLSSGDLTKLAHSLASRCVVEMTGLATHLRGTDGLEELKTIFTYECRRLMHAISERELSADSDELDYLVTLLNDELSLPTPRASRTDINLFLSEQTPIFANSTGTSNENDALIRLNYDHFIRRVCQLYSEFNDSQASSIPHELQSIVYLFSSGASLPADRIKSSHHSLLISFLSVAQSSRSAEGFASLPECDLALRVLTAMIREHIDDASACSEWQAALSSRNMISYIANLFREPLLMKSAWELLIALLEGGNMKVQGHMRELLVDPTSNMTPFLQLVREELSRTTTDLHNSTRSLQKQREDEAAITQLVASSDDWSALLPFSETDKAAFQWMLSLLRGLQLFAEGHKKFLQDFMRGYRPNGTPSVNFVSQMSQELQLVHRHIETGADWVKIIEQYLATITEICQGNEGNLGELLDNEIAKVLSFILELRVSSYTNLKTILGAQKAALITVQSLLDLESDISRDNAKLIRPGLIYECMNRFYYLRLLFERAPSLGHVWSTEFAEEIPEICDMMDNMAFRCHWILRRLEDVLPGQSYRWPGADALVEEIKASSSPTLIGLIKREQLRSMLESLDE